MENQLFTMEGFKIDGLSHSGVKGQKWGVRKYQNPDGSLTPLGKIHYGGQKIKKSIETKFNITPENAAHYQAVGKKVMKVAVPVGVGVASIGVAKGIYTAVLLNKFKDMATDMMGDFEETAKSMHNWIKDGAAEMDAKYDAAVKESEANWEQSHEAFEEFGRKNGLADFGDFAKRKR